MLREVHGLGTLVPEETMLIPATTDGRVAQILVRPGTPVKADSVVMVLVNPDLDTAALDAQYAVKAAEADYENLKVTLQKALLDIKSTAAQVAADYNTAKLQADRDAALAEGRAMAERLRERMAGMPSPVSIAGPAPAYVPRRGGRWRFNLVLRGADPVALLGGDPGPPWSVDVDPESLL